MAKEGKTTRDKLKRRLAGGLLKYTFTFSVTAHFGVWALLGWRAAPPPTPVPPPERESTAVPAMWPYEKLPAPPSVEPAKPARMPEGISSTVGVGEIPIATRDDDTPFDTIPDPHDRTGNEVVAPGGPVIVENPGGTVTAPVSASPEYVEFVPTTKTPTLVYQRRQKYPAVARDSRVEGIVVLMVYIDERGEVRNVLVQSSPGLPALEDAAKEAAYGCKFTPAEQQGVAVGVWYNLVMEFRL